MENNAVRVITLGGFDRPLDYLVPGDLSPRRGDWVWVTLRGRRCRALVIDPEVKSDIPLDKLKAIEDIADSPRMTQDEYALAEFVSDYYQSPMGMVLQHCAPPRRVSLPNRKLRPEKTESTDSLRDLTVSQQLNHEQSLALDCVTESLGRHHVFLLHGVTGSGKTEVALELAREAIRRGGQTLMLVPEINLTPQWAERIAARLPEARLALLHSRLAEGERSRAWYRAQSGEANLVLGTRLAVFASLPNLHLIVIDEEHDTSYKQQETPRYHARDVAIFRARQVGAPVLLASATPSLESLVNAQRSRYTLLRLTQRATLAPMPLVRVVPARGRAMVEGVSPMLIEALKARIARGEQCLVFLNRRGYAPRLHCAACDWQGECPHCDAAWVYHRGTAAQPPKLVCHHCASENAVPNACPQCGNPDILPLGLGTQRIELALKQALPEARLVRVDLDSTRRKDDWPQIKASIEARAFDVIVGTQMIAKGHDFPGITLVGVVGADDALFSADLRAGEALFAQLMQVSGRAGRRAESPGEVIVQSEYPRHPLLQALIDQDYTAYAARVCKDREEQALPPFTRLALVRASASASEPAQALLAVAFEALQSQGPELAVFPPVPSPMNRLAGQWRWQLMVTSYSVRALSAALKTLRTQLSARTSPGVDWTIDVDPYDFS